MTDQPSLPALPVWGISIVARPSWGCEDNQPRVIVAARSRAAAVRAIQTVSPNVTDSFMKTYGHTSANPVEVKAATSEPGTVFVETGRVKGVAVFAALRPGE